jgi:hypothetical protein
MGRKDGPRVAAKKARKTRYFTGIPCVRGHLTERITANGNCSECDRQKKREFKRRHRNKVNAANRDYRSRNGDSVRAREAKARANNPDIYNAPARRYRGSQKGRVGHAKYEANRRALMLTRSVKWADQAAIAAVYAAAAKLSVQTGCRYDVDHVIPLQGKLVCGLHVEFNLRPFLKKSNIKKSNKFCPEQDGLMIHTSRSEAMHPLRVFMGFDAREVDAYRVAEDSLYRTASRPVSVTPLHEERLAAHGLLRRPTDLRGGQMYDLHSNAPRSTAFAISRFLTPLLAQTGFVLFVDCDVVFLDDVAKLFALADPRYALQVVPHNMAGGGMKMDGQVQTSYSRKGASSVMLFNCDHPANRRLTITDVNERPGRDLHQFFWLNDAEIGELPERFNWLVNVRPRPDDVVIAHFTLGGMFTPGWPGAEHDDIWLEAAAKEKVDVRRIHEDMGS